MTKKLLSLLGSAVIVAGPASVVAEEGTKGTLMVDNKNYSLPHAVAYEAKIDDEEMIAVVLSGSAITSEQLKNAREEEEDGQDPQFRRPFLRLQFTKAGELKLWSAGAGNTSLGRRSGNAKGDLKLQDGRVIGQASQPNETSGMFPSGFDVRFDVALLKAGESLPASAEKKRGGPAANVKPSVSGTFKGNGKDAKLAHVSAHWREPFNDKPGIALVFTERDHSKAQKPDFDAAFGKFGSALIISLHEDGNIFGCQVVHTAHKKQGFTSLGRVQTNNFEYADGKVQGELATDGELDVFGETWQADLKFVAPLGETPSQFQPAKAKQTSQRSDDDEDEEEKASAAKTAELKVKDLPLTKDATETEYKQLVEHVLFKSKSNVKAVCAELAASLKAQGWTVDGRDMVNPNSSILKRKRGDASLTIFVKPHNGGSEVKIFTEGLDWDD
ncbi:MAG TPA: hypothetical protein VG095_06520 [Chthoniobacterales bacterium]|nr:hypothetical protein [Chthoniobacterales bacterium]